ncbi:Endothelin-converting enzyme like protein [Argiope bruennichi]|uniref:Endothelin-converting enzyme like protein n=1 Tax=Argiope bruennichi TaxID=94029 RepID=A0A8T0F9A1_ARGBR|nr:Endothelin-converting enzyme like protein [Argiope bruennichi]
MKVLVTSFSSLRIKFKQKTTLEKSLICALLLLSFLVIGLTTALILSHTKKQGNNEIVCQTAACQSVGQSIRNSLDRNVDPCNDFYSYCCGGWEKNHQIPPDLKKYGAIEELQMQVLHQLKDLFENKESQGLAARNMLNFYRSCINTSSIENLGSTPFLKFVREWGGWPVIDTNWSSKLFDPLTALANIQLKTGRGYILPLSVSTDPRNTSRKLIEIDQAPLMIADKILLKRNEESAQKELKRFENLFIKLALILGSTRSNFSEDFNSIVDLEIKMLQMMTPPEKLESNNQWYNKMPIKDLKRRIPQIDWLRYIQEFSNSSLSIQGKGNEITKEDLVIVRDLPYAEKISHYIRNEKNFRQISTYLGLRVLLSLLTHLPENFTVALHEFYRDNGVPLQISDRWKICINRINSIFGMIAGFLYVKEYFSLEDRNEVRKLVLDLSFEFEKQLLYNNWMDRETKKAALEKLRAMKVNVGFPDWITDESNLDDFYIKTNMPTMEDEVFENDLKITQYRIMQLIKSLRIIPKKEEWPMSPTIINAAYNRNMNSITFPAAFLQLPLYNSSLPRYFNYAAIGSIIGHEITHGFDSCKGSKRNASGELFNWWTDETKQIFEKKADCFIKQYNDYGLDGKRTLAENIADNGGLHQSYKAFSSWRKKQLTDIKLPGLENFSLDQLFFITYGSIWCTKYAPGMLNRTIREAEHAPSPYRLRITTANLQAFSDSFNCHFNISSSFENRCSIW